MTEPTSGLCCTHGERIDRILQLMEDVHEARVEKPCGSCEERKREDEELLEQWKQEFMARHGLATDHDEQSLELAHDKATCPGHLHGYCRECDGQIITAEQVRNSPVAQAALEKLNQTVASDSIPAHLSPAESAIPGPNGPIHIRHSYGDQPAQFTEIDMDDLKDEGDQQ